MKSVFLGKKLLFLIAHPDDETYLAVGTILKNAQKGGQTVIVCATAGEHGKAHLKKTVSKKQLKTIRKKELQAVSTFACVDKLHILDFPDTKILKHGERLKLKMLGFIKKYSPDYLISFGLDGVTGHLDHIACSRVARQVSKEAKIPCIRFCAAPVLVSAGGDWLQSRRTHGRYAPFGNHTKPKIKVKVDPEFKYKCFCLHESQQPLKNMPQSVLKHILNYEYFCD